MTAQVTVFSLARAVTDSVKQWQPWLTLTRELKIRAFNVKFAGKTWNEKHARWNSKIKIQVIIRSSSTQSQLLRRFCHNLANRPTLIWMIILISDVLQSIYQAQCGVSKSQPLAVFLLIPVSFLPRDLGSLPVPCPPVLPRKLAGITFRLPLPSGHARPLAAGARLPPLRLQGSTVPACQWVSQLMWVRLSPRLTGSHTSHVFGIASRPGCSVLPCMWSLARLPMSLSARTSCYCPWPSAPGWVTQPVPGPKWSPSATWGVHTAANFACKFSFSHILHIYAFFWHIPAYCFLRSIFVGLKQIVAIFLHFSAYLCINLSSCFFLQILLTYMSILFAYFFLDCIYQHIMNITAYGLVYICILMHIDAYCCIYCAVFFCIYLHIWWIFSIAYFLLHIFACIFIFFAYFNWIFWHDIELHIYAY